MLVDCYSVLRLRGKYNKADRVIFYMGQAHIKELVKFYTDILGSYKVAFQQVNQPGPDFRCLQLGPEVQL
jgi:hypothetical protein